jgi:hypothetical protein
VAERDAAEGRRDQVHDALRDCHHAVGHRAIGEELVVLGPDGDHRVANGEGELRNGERQAARNQVAPGHPRERELRQPKCRPCVEQLLCMLRVEHV